MDNKEMSIDELHLEKMRYNNNTTSYWLGLGGMVFSLIACFIGLNSVKPSSILTLFMVLINILVFLVGFLSAEKVKVYSKKYCYFMYGLGGVCFARIFIYPLILIINYSKYKDSLTNPDSDTKYLDYLGASITEKNGYLWSNGTFRAVLLIVLLGCATACFITAGVIGYIRQKKLNGYLKTLKN